jgi:hypothetical protein
MSRDAKKKKPDPAGPLVTLKTAAFTFETTLSHQCTSIYLSIYLPKNKNYQTNKFCKVQRRAKPKEPHLYPLDEGKSPRLGNQ